MARAQPLYTVEDQYLLLDRDLPISLSTINSMRCRLLIACSNSGTLDAAKNRFLNLIQDTEINLLFSSILDIPETRETIGVQSIQNIHGRFSSNYGHINKCLRELAITGVPSYTIDLFNSYFSSNEDPLYKLSVMASIVMMAYIKDDEINNRK